MTIGELFADFRTSADSAHQDSRAGIGAVVPAWQLRKTGQRASIGRLVSLDSLKLLVMGLLVTSAVLHLYATRLNTDLLDYGSFWESGRAVNEGNNPYGVYSLTHQPAEPPYANPNLNPPTSLLLLAPLARFEPYAGRDALWWVDLIVFASILAFLTWRYRPPEGPLLIAWAVALPVFWSSLALGQIYVLLLLLGAVGWWLLKEGRWFGAGVAIGLLAAIKPNMLVWPGLLFLAGYRREAIVAGISFLGFSALPALFFGVEVYSQWFEVLVGDDPVRRSHFVNASFSGIAARLGVPTAGLAISGVALLSAAVFALLWRPGKMETSAFAIVLATVASPLAWAHYLLFLLPSLLTLQRWRLSVLAGCCMLSIPIGVIGRAGVEMVALFPGKEWLSGVTLQSFYGWAAVLLSIGLARDFADARTRYAVRRND